MTPIVITYLAYLSISIILTVWVATTLHKNGRIFLVDSLSGNGPLADSINHLLVVGFYLINIGYISLALKESANIQTFQQILELLSGKVGWVMVILGLMHFMNIVIFSNMRKKALNQQARLSPTDVPLSPNPHVQ